MALKKNDVAERIREELDLTKPVSVELTESLLELIKSSLASGDDVLVSGFGKFSVKEKEVRRGRNPSKGTDLMLRSRCVVTFKCSGKLRQKINGN